MQSKEDLIKQYQFAGDKHQEEEVFLEVLIDIRDVIAYVADSLNTIKENTN